MVRFAHIADCHLGGWKQPELQALNFAAFTQAIDACIQRKVEFVVFAGDIFDSAYPPIEILREAFYQFRRLKEADIPAFLIAGSHDSSVSGKTFLDVLDRTGFCTSVEKFEERGDHIMLYPTVFGDVALYGYPGKRSGLEVQDLKRVKFQDAPGLLKLFMMHTTMTKVKGDLPIDSVDEDQLPFAHYYALGHIHVVFQYENFVYPGPTFPNNFKELEDLHHGGFFIVDTDEDGSFTLDRVELKNKKVEVFDIELHSGIIGTEVILRELQKRELEDKIVLLRIRGELEEGKNADIKFADIEEFVAKQGAYFMLRNTHDLKTKEVYSGFQAQNTENIEGETIQTFTQQHNSPFNALIPDVMNALSMEKQEDEKSVVFESRLLEEVNKIFNIGNDTQKN